MARVVLLDSGPLVEATHPGSEKRGPIREWLFRFLDAEAYPRLPEIMDYEHRRAAPPRRLSTGRASQALTKKLPKSFDVL
ncbi:MAG: hypothetical protein H0U04_13595 [Rubrobacter sp.]|nr:hypothetical protein [Rubrobacter sp.]